MRVGLISRYTLLEWFFVAPQYGFNIQPTSYGSQCSPVRRRSPLRRPRLHPSHASRICLFRCSYFYDARYAASLRPVRLGQVSVQRKFCGQYDNQSKGPILCLKPAAPLSGGRPIAYRRQIEQSDIRVRPGLGQPWRPLAGQEYSSCLLTWANCYIDRIHHPYQAMRMQGILYCKRGSESTF